MALLSKTKDSVACMLDDRFFRFFHVTKTGKKTELKNFFSERIPDELFDDHNVLKPNHALVTRLQETRKRYGFSKVHLVIPDRYVTVFHTVVPRSLFGTGSITSLQQAIERYLEKLLIEHPEFSQTDMISDYEIIGEKPEGYDVHVSVARPAQFAYIPELLESAGFVVDHIDIASFSLHRLAKYINQESAYGIISMGSHTTHVSMVHEGKVIASSWCQVGSNDLIKVIEKTINVNRAEAERIIHQYGILHIHPDKKVLAGLLAALRPVVEAIGQIQVACSPVNYQHPFYHKDQARFYMYGIGTSISGIAQYLGIKSNTTVRSIDVIPTEFLDEEIIIQIPIEVLPLYLPVMSTAVNYLAE